MRPCRPPFIQHPALACLIARVSIAIVISQILNGGKSAVNSPHLLGAAECSQFSSRIALSPEFFRRSSKSSMFSSTLPYAVSHSKTTSYCSRKHVNNCLAFIPSNIQNVNNNEKSIAHRRFQPRTNIEKPQLKLFWSYKLYDLGNKKNSDDDSNNEQQQPLLYGSCERVFPAIKPQTKVMDQVEEWYPTEYKSYRFHNLQNGSNGEIKNADDDVTLSIRETSFGCGKLGHTVWESSLALSCHLVSRFGNTNKSSNKELRVIELGSGCGVPSCVCRELGVDKILATDFWDNPSATFVSRPDGDRLVPHNLFGVNLEFNLLKSAGLSGEEVATSNEDRCTVEKLDWYSEFEIFQAKLMIDPNLIIASDVVYYEQDVVPLVRTLEILLDDRDHSIDDDDDNADDKKEQLMSTETRPPKEALIFLRAYREGVPLFREKVKELVAAHDGWTMEERDLLLLQDSDIDDSEYNPEEEQFFRVSIKTG